MDRLDRRTLLVGAAAAGAALAPRGWAAQPVSGTGGVPTGTAPYIPAGFERFPIWPGGGAPGGEHVTVREEEELPSAEAPLESGRFAHIVTPTLTMLRPAKPNGAAMLLVPGGGYVRVAIGIEGYAVARRFAEAGYTCFVLLYRLPGDGWAAGPEAPLQDAQRALRIVRSLAGREKFDPNRVGTIGFSAGGHLAGWLSSVTHDSYAPVDAVDRESARPNATGMLYPVVLMDGPSVHMGSRTQLIGAAPGTEAIRATSVEQIVTGATPPTFLAHALDDMAVPPENSLAMLAALRARNIPAECHLFENGGHGFGLTARARSAAPWPDLFLAFAQRHGV